MPKEVKSIETEIIIKDLFNIFNNSITYGIIYFILFTLKINSPNYQIQCKIMSFSNTINYKQIGYLIAIKNNLDVINYIFKIYNYNLIKNISKRVSIQLVKKILNKIKYFIH